MADITPSVRSLWHVMRALDGDLEACVVLPRRVTARLRSKLTRAGKDAALAKLTSLLMLEDRLGARLSEAKPKASAGGGSTMELSATLGSVAMSADPDAAAALAEGEMAVEVAASASLVRWLIRESQDDRELRELFRAASESQVKQSLGVGGLARPPAILTEESQLPAGVGLTYVTSLMRGAAEVLEDRLAHSSEELRLRQSNIADGKASVDRLKRQLKVEEDECSRLAGEHARIKQGQQAMLDHLTMLDRSYKLRWEVQQRDLAAATTAKTREDDEAHADETADLASKQSVLVAEAEASEAKSSEEEALARIKRKRAAIEASKVVEDYDAEMLRLLQTEDELEAEIHDQELQIRALEDFLGLVESERGRSGGETADFESRRAERLLRRRLLQSGSARKIQRAWGIFIEARRAQKKAAKKAGKKKKK